MSTTEAPGIEEKYVNACHASNLRVEADRPGSADVIIAAGWSPNRIGAALLRLHSEWDGAEKPRRWPAALVEELTDKLAGPRANAMARAVAGVTAAAQAHQSYLHESAILFGKLKTMPAVRSQVILQLRNWEIANAETVGPAVLLHWLDSVCHTCGGLKFLRIPNAPALSKNRCKDCQGTGVSPVPYGGIGRRLETFLDDCTQRARQQISSRLHSMIPRG